MQKSCFFLTSHCSVVHLLKCPLERCIKAEGKIHVKGGCVISSNLAHCGSCCCRPIISGTKIISVCIEDSTCRSCKVSSIICWLGVYCFTQVRYPLKNYAKISGDLKCSNAVAICKKGLQQKTLTGTARHKTRRTAGLATECLLCVLIPDIAERNQCSAIVPCKGTL